MKKLLLSFLLLVIVIGGICQPIPRSTPEAEGVSSVAIAAFIDSLHRDKHEPHSIMIIRHGKVIAEGWWAPYAPDLKHSMYSVSKSWTSTAIGLAVGEGKLAVTDKVLSFFPEYGSLGSKQNLADVTIKDLLTMSVGHDKESFETVFMQPDWARGFLGLPVVHKPGTKFLYNTTATYMLSAIIQKVTGQTLMAYLTPRLFQPLGINGVDWEINFKGINTGGWGFRDKTEDMAKLGLLYLNKGIYNGKQILSANWVTDATSKQVEQKPDAPQQEKNASDWLQGYGYQFWRCRNNAFRADGAFGQYIVMMPDQDAVVVMTSESLDMQEDLGLIWRRLLPAFEPAALAENTGAVELLNNKTKDLHIDAPSGKLKKGDRNLLNINFKLSSNALNFTGISIVKKGKQLLMQVETKDKKSHRFVLGRNAWAKGETDLVGPYLLRIAPIDFNALGNFKLASAYRWVDRTTLECTIQYIESPHHWRMLMHMEGDKLQLKIINSFSPDQEINVVGE